MNAEIWLERRGRKRSETFHDYHVEVSLVPEEKKTCSVPLVPVFGGRARSEVSVHPERPVVSVQFRGTARSRSSVVGEDHSAVGGFSLPKADALRLAESILLACSSDETDGVSVVPLDQSERPCSLSDRKVVFKVASTTIE